MTRTDPKTFEMPLPEADLPPWTASYPDKYRTYLARMGGDDKGDAALIAYNRDLIKLAEDCQGRGYGAYEVEWVRLLSVWGPVRNRHKRISRRPSGLTDGRLNFPWLEARSATEKEWDVEFDLRQTTGIAVTSALIYRMTRHRLGPRALRGLPNAHAQDVCWVGAVFGLMADRSEAPDFGVADRAPPVSMGSPIWLVASEEDDPDANLIHEYLEAAGAYVVHTTTALEAAQTVSRGGLTVVVIRFDNNVEAEYVIADICMRQEIGFLVIVPDGDRPDDLGLGGVVLHRPMSFAEIRAALRTLPQATLVGLDFSRMPERPEAAPSSKFDQVG